MDCDRWIEALSALADGEEPGIEPRLLQTHLARCPGCRSFADALDQLTPASRVMAAPVMPDLSVPVVRSVRLADRAASWSIVRIVLAVVSIQIVVLALPNVFQSGPDGGHDARHLAAFSIAYAAGLMVVVARPARARTMLPVAAVLAAALVLTALVDVARGDIPLVNESLHLPEVISVALIWLLANPVRNRRSQRPAAPALRVVERPQRHSELHGEAR